MIAATKNFDFIEWEEALTILLKCAPVTGKTEDVSLFEAAGRIAAADYRALLPNPPFNRSPLDGYAVSHRVFLRENNGGNNGGKNRTVVLPVTMKLYAGDRAAVPLKEGCAARIMTGAMIPQGADCVIRQEDTDYGEEWVELFKGAEGGENICFEGEDIKMGDGILSKGEKLTAASIALMAAQGIKKVRVFERLLVGVISTGSELVSAEGGLEQEPGLLQKPGLLPGKIFDSNGPMVCARLCELGIRGDADTVEDEAAVIADKIRGFMKECDAVITTGGVSVGQKDCMPQVMELLGADVLFHGVAMKPGSPMLAAVFENKLIFSLSGNPFAAYATLELLVIPALMKQSGRKDILPVRAQGILLENFPKESVGRRFIRGSIGRDGVRIPGNHSSGAMAGCRGCSCFVDIPAGSGPLKAGDRVNLVLFYDSAVLALPSLTFRERMAPVPVYAVSGLHKTGKTTVLEETIRCLKEGGCCVAVIKHDGHDFEPDVPGTDSYRLKKAGADSVFVFSDKLEAMVQDTGGLSVQSAVEYVSGRMSKQADIILLEGFKQSDYPKLMLTEQKADRLCLQEKGKRLAEHLLREIRDE